MSERKRKKLQQYPIFRRNLLGLSTEAEKDALIEQFWRDVAKAKIEDALEEKKTMREFLDENNKIH